MATAEVVAIAPHVPAGIGAYRYDNADQLASSTDARGATLTPHTYDPLGRKTVSLAEDWRIEYNTIRPHGPLGGLTPTQFRLQRINQRALS